MYMYMYFMTYVCLNRSRDKIEKGARIDSGCQLSISLIEAGAQIRTYVYAGFQYTLGSPVIKRKIVSTLRHNFRM